MNSVITGLLNKYLGPFCENLDGSQFSFGLFTGQAVIRDITLKPAAIESALSLPLRLHRGHIGSITLDIPLTKLREKPVVVTVEDVYLQLLPQYGPRAYNSFISEVVRGQRLKPPGV